MSVFSAIGGSGLLIVGRDVWLARKTVRTSEKAEERNSAREPLIVESILLGNTTKVAELFQAGISELEGAKNRLAEEFRETKERLEEEIGILTAELAKVKELLQERDKTISELHAKIGEQQIQLDALERRT